MPASCRWGSQTSRTEPPPIVRDRRSPAGAAGPCAGEAVPWGTDNCARAVDHLLHPPRNEDEVVSSTTRDAAGAESLATELGIETSRPAWEVRAVKRYLGLVLVFA